MIDCSLRALQDSTVMISRFYLVSFWVCHMVVEFIVIISDYCLLSSPYILGWNFSSRFDHSCNCSMSRCGPSLDATVLNSLVSSVKSFMHLLTNHTALWDIPDHTLPPRFCSIDYDLLFSITKIWKHISCYTVVCHLNWRKLPIINTLVPYWHKMTWTSAHL